jgi:hypothetical protein
MIETVRALLTHPKGLLAMDGSNGACDKRFAAAGGYSAATEASAA